MQLLEWGPKEGGIKTLNVLTENSVQYTYVLKTFLCECLGNTHNSSKNRKNATLNKLAKLGDAIAISKSETMNDSLTDSDRGGF